MNKECTQCGETKDSSQFRKDSRLKSGHRAACKACGRKRDRKQYEQKREVILERQKEWRERNPEYGKEYYQKNREVILERQKEWREQNLEHRKEHYQKNKEWYQEKSRIIAQQRRAIELNLPAETIVDNEVFERDNWVCQYCKEPVDPDLRWPDPKSKSLDHVVSLSVPDSPGHIRDNCQLVHLVCNMKKQ